MSKKGHTEEQILRARRPAARSWLRSAGSTGGRGDVLRLEEEILRAGLGGIARVTASARGDVLGHPVTKGSRVGGAHVLL